MVDLELAGVLNEIKDQQLFSPLVQKVKKLLESVRLSGSEIPEETSPLLLGALGRVGVHL